MHAYMYQKVQCQVRLLKGDKNILDAAPAILNTKQTIISLFHMQICIVYFNQNIWETWL